MVLSRADKTYKAICYAVGVLTAIACLYPLLYTFFVSICSQREWIDRNGLLLWFPSHPTFVAYAKVLLSGGYVARAGAISALRTIIGTALSVFVNVCTGYVLSRRNLPGKKGFLAILMFTVLFGAGLIPVYLTIDSVGLMNTFWVMVIPTLFSAWNALIFKQFFEGIPRELEEAAMVDGTGEFVLMTRIILPMSKAVVAAIALFTAVGHWNSWFDAMVYINPKHSRLWPLQLFTMINFNNMQQVNSNSSSAVQFMAQGQGVMQVSQKMALTIVTLLPILVVYPFFQKYFTKGVYAGAIKG